MSDLSALESRIAALEDIEAIKQLKYCYLNSCDQKQIEQVRNCFVDGPMEIDYGRIGTFGHRDELVEIFQQLGCHDHIVDIHHAQNPIITLKGDGAAKGEWGLFFYQIDTQQQRCTQFGATYYDEYRKVAGEWKISATRCVVHSTQLVDASEGVMRMLFAGGAVPE